MSTSRTALALALAACFVSGRARAQEEPPVVPDAAAIDRMAQAIEAPTPAASAAPRTFGDGAGSTVPWNDRDPELEPLPGGLAHAGVQVSATASNSPIGLPFGLEIFGYLDLRLELGVHVRMGGVLGGQVDQGTGDPQRTSSRGLGVYSGGGRVLVGAVAPRIAARIGGEVGGEWLDHSLGAVELYAGGLVEVAWRMLDDQRLELVVAGALQNRSVSHNELSRGVLVVEDYLAVRCMLGLGVVL
jgi:hypothetical protein